MSIALFDRSITANTHATCAQAKPSKAGIWARISYAHGLWVQRRTLARLSREQLNDIGLTPAQARDEAERPIWDAPKHWRI